MAQFFLTVKSVMYKPPPFQKNPRNFFRTKNPGLENEPEAGIISSSRMKRQGSIGGPHRASTQVHPDDSTYFAGLASRYGKRVFINDMSDCPVCLQPSWSVVMFACGHGVCNTCHLGLVDPGLCVICRMRSDPGELVTFLLPDALRDTQCAFEAQFKALNRLGSGTHTATSGDTTGKECIDVGLAGDAVLLNVTGREATAGSTISVFVLDVSGSMGTGGMLNDITSGFDRILCGMIGCHFAAVSFSCQPRTVVRPLLITPANIGDVVAAISGLRPDGLTNLGDALEHAEAVAVELETLAASTGAVGFARLVVVTDGQASDTDRAREVHARLIGAGRETKFEGIGCVHDFDHCPGSSPTDYTHHESVEALVNSLSTPERVRSLSVHGDPGSSAFVSGRVVPFEGVFRFAIPAGAFKMGLRGPVHLDTLEIDGARVFTRACARLSMDVGCFLQQTLALDYLTSLSFRIANCDVHAHAGMLKRTRRALLAAGPSNNSVVSLIDMRIAGFVQRIQGDDRSDATLIARAVSCTTRTLSQT
jgi:hypothetical protein